MAIQELKLSKVQLIDEAQPRERIDLDVIGEYAEVLKAGGTLPPVPRFVSRLSWLDRLKRKRKLFQHCSVRSLGALGCRFSVQHGSASSGVRFSCLWPWRSFAVAPVLDRYGRFNFPSPFRDRVVDRDGEFAQVRGIVLGPFAIAP